VRVFAVASAADGTKLAKSSASLLQGVILAATRSSNAASDVHKAFSEDFIVRDIKTAGEKWRFPCLAAASAATVWSVAPALRVLLNIWFFLLVVVQLK
jgi:hypothetical protein